MHGTYVNTSLEQLNKIIHMSLTKLSRLILKRPIVMFCITASPYCILIIRGSNSAILHITYILIACFITDINNTAVYLFFAKFQTWAIIRKRPEKYVTIFLKLKTFCRLLKIKKALVCCINVLLWRVILGKPNNIYCWMEGNYFVYETSRNSRKTHLWIH